MTHHSYTHLFNQIADDCIVEVLYWFPLNTLQNDDLIDNFMIIKLYMATHRGYIILNKDIFIPNFHKCKFWTWKFCDAFGDQLTSREVLTTHSYLSDIFLLFRLKSQLNKDLLQLLIAVIDDKLFKTVILENLKYWITLLDHLWISVENDLNYHTSTLYTLTSVCTFSSLFSIHFQRCW